MTWQNKNTAEVQDAFYRQMKDKFSEFTLADGDWKIELFATLNYPSYVRSRKAEFSRQDTERTARQPPAPAKKNKGKSKGTHELLSHANVLIL